MHTIGLEEECQSILIMKRDNKVEKSSEDES
jgi:hypothetical protein